MLKSIQKTAILILAAGSSSRMGTTKQLLPYKETTLVGWAIEQAQKSIANKIFCVLGANETAIREALNNDDSTIISNPTYKEGLSTSIVAGINYIKHTEIDSVLIMLGDQPAIDTNYLNAMLVAAKENPTKIVASNYKHKTGVPAIFPKFYFNQLLNIKGDKGAKELLNKESSEIIKMKPFNLLDIDTAEDYQNLIKLGETR